MCLCEVTRLLEMQNPNSYKERDSDTVICDDTVCVCVCVSIFVIVALSAGYTASLYFPLCGGFGSTPGSVGLIYPHLSLCE